MILTFNQKRMRRCDAALVRGLLSNDRSEGSGNRRERGPRSGRGGSTDLGRKALVGPPSEDQMGEQGEGGNGSSRK